MPTLEITNWGGPLVRKKDGPINSGLVKFDNSWGYDPYSNPGNLTWMEQPTSILTIGSIAGAVVAQEHHVEYPFSYAYVVTNDGTLRKVNVANDSPSVVGALFNAPSAANGADIVFYGTTEKVFYGDDGGIQKINIDGSGAASIVGTSSVVANVPRPMTTFLGKVYFGNSNNIGEIDTTETITTGSKLSPALPMGVVVRDLDVTPDGNYLRLTAMKYNPTSGFISPDTAQNAGIQSYRFLWNGIDNSFTSYESYEGIGLTASAAFGSHDYSTGYDSTGSAILSGSTKIVSLIGNSSPFSPGLLSVGNMLGIVSTEYDDSTGRTNGCVYLYGKYDSETPGGLFRMLKLSAPVQPDIITMPICTNVSNILHIPSVIGVGTLNRQGKVYFSTQEASSSSGNSYICRLWKFSTAPVGVGSIVGGVYETQTQLFSKRVAIKQVRLYTDPLVAGNSFTIDLIGSGGSVLAGTSRNFTVGTNVTALDDMVQYTPQSKPTYAIAARITNASVTGTKNWVANKLEIDYADAGN